MCHFDEDCTDNGVCFSDGKCLKECTLQHSNCPQGHICDVYEKACLPHCGNNQICPEGLSCFSDGSCLKPCQNTNQCNSNTEHCDQ